MLLEKLNDIINGNDEKNTVVILARYVKEHIEEIPEMSPDELAEKNISAMKQAIEEDGVEMLGYTSWGCIDLVSNGTGEVEKRYGFIYVDKDNQGNGTLKRYKKDSFYWYKQVIGSNGEVL